MTTKPRNFPRFGGVKARPRLSFARASPKGNARGGTVLTFGAGTQNWVAPAGARVLQRLSGKGQDGQPATGASHQADGYNTRSVYHQEFYYTNGTIQRNVYPGAWSGFFAGIVPSESCYGYQQGQDLEGNTVLTYTCDEYRYDSVEDGNYVPATSGAAATAFGQVFAGGPQGLPASPVILYNVLIEPGTSYQIVVPAGAYVTIEY